MQRFNSRAHDENIARRQRVLNHELACVGINESWPIDARLAVLGRYLVSPARMLAAEDLQLLQLAASPAATTPRLAGVSAKMRACLL